MRAPRVLAAFALGLGVLAALPLQGAAVAERPFAVVDLHVDLSYQHNYRGRTFAGGSGQFPGGELVRAGVVGVVLPLYVPRRVSPAGPRLEHFEASYARVFSALARTEPYRLPGCLPRRGGVATWLAFEGAGALAGGAGGGSGAPAAERALIAWAARGVRVLGPVHAFTNELASSSGDAGGARFGLTPAGRDVMRRAAALGMALDVSHASDRATREIVVIARESGAPVVATHSNARVLADHPRNLADAELRAIAATGGVVGLNFHSAFLARGRRATLADAVAHAKHLVRVMGPEHVAIGSDFEGDVAPPAELAGPAGYQRLARALLEAGLSRSSVEGVMSKNALRVLCRAGGID